MDNDVRNDILALLRESLGPLRKGDTFALAQQSDALISYATVFQDEYTIAAAVLLYSLAKVIQHGKIQGKELEPQLRHAVKALADRNEKEYALTIKRILNQISKADGRRYANTVVQQAQVRKGCSMCESGISLARASEILGITQWDMRRYMGQRTTTEPSDVKPGIAERLDLARAKPKTLIFDSGPVISFTMNNLLWLLTSLKKHYGATFLFPAAVKREIIDNPLDSKKFKFEALQVQQLVNDKTLELIDDEKFKQKTLHILDLANSIFSVRGQPIKIMHYAEASVLAAALELEADAIVVDERVTRELIEHPAHLMKVMRKRFHDAKADQAGLKKLRAELKGIRVLRSIELGTIAFEQGMLDKYLSLDVGINRRVLLESVLWGMKTDGTAVSVHDIEEILRIENV